MSSWRSHEVGRLSQRTGERHVAGLGSLRRVLGEAPWAGGHVRVAWATHMPPIRATGSRTYPCFRPHLAVGGAKPGQVRAHLPPIRGISRALPLVFCRFRPSEARTSPGFLPASRNSGRNRPQVRVQMAERRHKCASLTHIPRFHASRMAERKHMCASGTHIPWFPASRETGNGHRCASLTHMSPVPAIGRAESKGMCATVRLG